MGTALLIAAALIFSGLFVVFSLLSGASYTEERQALPNSATVETAYYTDEDGDWIHSPNKLTEGLKSFYSKTGVQPYVYILPNGTTTSIPELQQRAETMYDELFQDEGHFLLVFCDDGDGGFNCGYAIGSEASSIMDAEALEILSENLDKRYNNYFLTEEQIFSKAFADTADEIMPKTKAPTIGSGISSTVTGFVIVGICIFILLRNKKRADDERKRREREAILSMPLEKFSDQHIESLAEKYEAPNERDQPRENAGSTIQP